MQQVIHKKINNLKVMVIDDNDITLEVVNMALERLGVVNVFAHASGESALDFMDSGVSVDVLLLDLNMPTMDGVEVLRNLVSRAYMGGVLLFSGEDTRILKAAESLAAAHGLNIVGVLQKPLCIEDLAEKLGMYKPVLEDALAAKLFEFSPQEIADGIQARQFVPFYQPKIFLGDNSVVSAEVLARWQHPEEGIVPPIAFISLAEENGLIDDLTWLIFEQAISDLRVWRKIDPHFTLGLNLSADSLATVDLPEKMEALINQFDVPSEAVVLEITESRLMQNLASCLDTLTRLCLKGFRLSIDDFGTGYSSMAQLSNIPFAELKIDRCFVHGSSADVSALAVLEASVSLANKLNMTMVAEGVENHADWERIIQVGCEVAQGYYFARPMTYEDFNVWKQQWRAVDI